MRGLVKTNAFGQETDDRSALVGSLLVYCHPFSPFDFHHYKALDNKHAGFQKQRRH